MMHALILLCINQHTTFEVPSFTHTKDMTVGEGQNLKMVTWPWPHPLGGTLWLILGIFFLRTKFGDSPFGRSRDMIAGVKIESGSCDPDHALFMDSLSSVSHDLIYSIFMQNLTTLASADPEIWLVPTKM